MSNNYNNPGFKKLLQKLQEESWQLELLISGFAIFGLFSVYEPVRHSLREAIVNNQFYKIVISYVGYYACVILIFNLLLHVLLRGLWIGALGLRYVSGDIDYDYLKYSKKFTTYLNKRVGSFDRYIATLENYCSIIFAISFLLLFYVLSLTFTILSIFVTAEYIIESDYLPKWFANTLGVIIITYLSFGMILTFIDFVTQGWLKKKQWISKIYFPFYWGFSFLTLSFLYRPIVYNFLDNKFGKRVSFILFPIFLALVLSNSFNYNFSNYFTKSTKANSFITSDNNYEDIAEKNEKIIIDDVSIQSKVVTDHFLKVYIKHSERIEDNIFAFNKSLKPENDNRGLSSGISFSSNRSKNKGRNLDSIRQVYLKLFNDTHSIKIDSTDYVSDFIVNKDRMGFETFLDIKGLKKGKHTLYVKRNTIRKKDTIDRRVQDIVFWYYPD